MRAGSERAAAVRTGDTRWRLRVRPGVRERSITRSRTFLSWSDELDGVRFACPRCDRTRAVVRRLRPTGRDTVYWLLCPSMLDRRGRCLSEEVLRELLTEAVGAVEACALLERHHDRPR